MLKIIYDLSGLLFRIIVLYAGFRMVTEILELLQGSKKVYKKKKK